MLTAVITRTGEVFRVEVVAPHAAQSAEAEVDPGPSPIAAEPKELLWGAGAFIVFLALMRLWLYPRLKKGIDARQALIRSGHETAEKLRADAQAEVATYRAQVAELKAEAAARVDVARQQLESERTSAIAAANAEIAAKRAAAAEQAAAARAAASDQIASAVATVSGRATALVIGRTPGDDAVRRAVDDVLGAGVAR